MSMAKEILCGRYEIVEHLGGGGFGQTFLAKDNHLPGNPFCVVKHLKPKSTDINTLQIAKRLFDREAETLYQLGDLCDCIPRLFAHFDVDGEFYLVQEFIEGTTLDRLIFPGKRFAETEVIMILQKILQPLSFVHQAQVIHRDLKPANLILRDRDGKIVLIDFGAVKALTKLNEDLPSQTILTVAIGSPGYMPNEQLAGQPHFSSDIYALGMICIEVLTGWNCQQIPKDPRTGELAWHDLAPAISPGFSELLDRMVRYDYRQRYVDASDALKALQELLERGATVALPPKIKATEIKATGIQVPVRQNPKVSQEGREIASDRTTQQKYRDRQILLHKVRNFWIEGVLETSLHDKVAIELGLSEWKDVLERPWTVSWETLATIRQDVPAGTKIVQLFERLGIGRSLLILGDPGSGKTTTLLELTRDLLSQAMEDIDRLMPVVFNLSSWANERQSIADWLVQELYIKYQVAKEIGKEWVRDQQLLLLLDGLDEVRSDLRDRCVQALNQFVQEYGQTEIVVCCRVGDYELLSQRLRLQGAIFIQPLTSAQIYSYLNGLGKDFTAIGTAISADATLQEIARSPLMLSIMTLAYQGISHKDLLEITDLEQRRNHLFDTYIQRMWQRRSGDRLYRPDRAMRWLNWLARQLVRQSQTIFLIERLQPDWLENPRQRWIYAIATSCLGGLIVGAIGAINVGSLFGLSMGLSSGIILGTGVGIAAAIVLGLIQYRIETVETLQWSSVKAKQTIPMGLRIGLSMAVIMAVGVQVVYSAFGLGFTPVHSFYHGISGLGTGVLFVLMRGLSGAAIETSAFPNQGIWKSFHNAVAFTVIGSITLGIVGYAAGIIYFGAFAGLLFGIFSPAGLACFQHFVLRLVLWCNGFAPWNYARFLDYCTQLIFLQKVGGGYIFIHRLLLEHFAKK